MADELYKVYETFTEELINNGWNGVEYGWTECVRGEITGQNFSLFAFDNGFRLQFNEPGMDGKGELSLQYWFEGEKTRTNVESLEQLLDLLN